MDHRIDTEIARQVAVASRDATDPLTQELACIPGVAAVATMPSGIVTVGVLGHVFMLPGEDAATIGAMMITAAAKATKAQAA